MDVWTQTRSYSCLLVAVLATGCETLSGSRTESAAPPTQSRSTQSSPIQARSAPGDGADPTDPAVVGAGAVAIGADGSAVVTGGGAGAGASGAVVPAGGPVVGPNGSVVGAGAAGGPPLPSIPQMTSPGAVAQAPLTPLPQPRSVSAGTPPMMPPVGAPGYTPPNGAPGAPPNGAPGAPPPGTPGYPPPVGVPGGYPTGGGPGGAPFAANDPHLRAVPTVAGGRWGLAPYETPADRLLELTRNLDLTLARNRELEARIKELEIIGVKREEALAEAEREIETLKADAAKTRAALQAQVLTLQGKIRNLEDEDVVYLRAVIDALGKLLPPERK